MFAAARRHSAFCIGAALLSVSLVPAAAADPIRLGVMGDSLSDEYLEESYSYALNWVQQASEFAGVDVGPTAAEAGMTTWGAPRRKGYKFNWARAGATSGSLLSQGQHTGCAGQVASEGLTHATLLIGANDFIPINFPFFAYYEIYNGNWSQSQINSYVADVVGNILTAADAVLAAGADLVLCGLPDYGVTVSVRDNFPDAVKRDRVTAVLRHLNDDLRAAAAARRIVYIDTLALTNAIFGPNQSPKSTLLIGNVAINLNQADTSSNTIPTAAFVHDGTHPHTHIQGIFANVMLEALDFGYGAGVPLFSEGQILDHAGIAYGGSDTLAAEIGAYRDYICNFAASPGDVNCDGSVNGFDVDPFALALSSPAQYALDFPCCDISKADVNLDGSINGFDVDPFVELLLGP
ncbi:MAG: hypothetical protein CHACPFDD_03053 [Phycisphaerae bacterium]|nr:hypothetical protein [Phycisphaerae bacterium]